MSQLSRGASRTLPTGARWPVSGSVGSILYCRSFVQQPQRIILDMDDIDDPSSNSPWCAVTATTAPSPRWCCRKPCAATTRSASPGAIFARIETTLMGTDVRFISPTLEGRGKALYEKSSGR